MWNRFKNMCMTCLNTIPSKMSSTRFNQPWITNYIKRLSKRKQRSFNKACSTNLPNDWTTYYNLKKESLRACQKAYNTYVTNFLHLKDSNSKKLWSFVKSKCKDHCTITSLQHNGQSYTDSITKANLFNSHFSSVFTQEDTSHVPNLSNTIVHCQICWPSLRINTKELLIYFWILSHINLLAQIIYQLNF